MVPDEDTVTPVAFSVVIPARFASSRFPGKPLHLLNGRAMVLHVLDRARESNAREVVVATDDARIADVCREAGADVELTRVDHASGTDRIAEVVRCRRWPDDTVIVGLQGDEPTTPPRHLDRLATNLAARPDADMATFCQRIECESDYRDPMRVKVVRDVNDMALYFSRAPIPWRRDPVDDSSFPEAWLHVGLYAYRAGFLARYTTFAPPLLEREEQLEQLRVLHAGGRIHVACLAGEATRGVDSPADVAAVEAALAAHDVDSASSGQTPARRTRSGSGR